tara:strand:+ start:60 stop:740 length:681 start_codon:yes stop_codon:yes gene_type:complete
MAKFEKIIIENNQNLLIKKFIGLLKQKIKNKKNDRFSFVLTGGNSPIELYKKLSKIKKINWKKIDFFIGDERYVDENSKDSNIRMCKKYLLSKINISNKQIYKISTYNNSLKESALNYEEKIKKYFLNKKISFDIILLGVGEDGHIASLFKKNINKKSYKNVDFVKRKDFLRITLTLKCLNNAKSIFLWMPGIKKTNLVEKILIDKKKKYPVSFLNAKNKFLFHCY